MCRVQMAGFHQSSIFIEHSDEEEGKGKENTEQRRTKD
jgi:hypothetical protein